VKACTAETFNINAVSYRDTFLFRKQGNSVANYSGQIMASWGK